MLGQRPCSPASTPFRVGAKRLFFNFEQLNFARKRTRTSGFEQYGSANNLNYFGSSMGWKRMLEHLVKNRVAKTAGGVAGSLVAVITRTVQGERFLLTLQLKAPALDLYRSLEQVD